MNSSAQSRLVPVGLATIALDDRLTLSWGQEIAIRLADRYLRLALLN